MKRLAQMAAATGIIGVVGVVGAIGINTFTKRKYLDTSTRTFRRRYRAGAVHPFNGLVEAMADHIKVPGGLSVDGCPGRMAPECLARLAVDQNIIYMAPAAISSDMDMAHSLEMALGLELLGHGWSSPTPLERTKNLLSCIEQEALQGAEPTILLIDHQRMYEPSFACTYFREHVARWAKRGDNNISVIVTGGDTDYVDCTAVEKMDIHDITADEAKQFVKDALMVSDTLTDEIVHYYQTNGKTCLGHLSQFVSQFGHDKENVLKSLDAHRRTLNNNAWHQLKLLWKSWSADERTAAANVVKNLGKRKRTADDTGLDILAGYVTLNDDGTIRPSSPAAVHALEQLKTRFK